MSTGPLQLERFESAAAALIHPPADEEAQAVARAEAERKAAEAQAETERMARLGESLSEIGRMAEQNRVAAISCVSEALGEAARALLPALSDAGFAHEISAAVLRLAEAGNLLEAELAVADPDHDLIAGLLADAALPGRISVVSDPVLTSGQARLRWAQGGARLEPAALIDAAGRILNEQIETHLTRTAHDE